MDLIQGWDLVGDIDPEIYRRATIGIGCDNNAVWSGGRLRSYNGPEHRVGNYIADSTLNEIGISNVVDRLPDNEVVPFWHEVYRVSAHGASVRLVGCYWTCVDVQADITRKRGLSEPMLARLSVGGRATLRADPLEDGVGLDVFEGIDLDPVQIVHVADPEWETRSSEAKAWHMAHGLNVVRRLNATLLVHKPCRIL